MFIVQALNKICAVSIMYYYFDNCFVSLLYNLNRTTEYATFYMQSLWRNENLTHRISGIERELNPGDQC